MSREESGGGEGSTRGCGYPDEADYAILRLPSLLAPPRMLGTRTFPSMSIHSQNHFRVLRRHGGQKDTRMAVAMLPLVMQSFIRRNLDGTMQSKKGR